VSKVVLFGNARFADMNHFCLSHDSPPHEVVAFTVDRAHIQQDELQGCPVFRSRTLNSVICRRGI
jgi:hypothetical protein